MRTASPPAGGPRAAASRRPGPDLLSPLTAARRADAPERPSRPGRDRPRPATPAAGGRPAGSGRRNRVAEHHRERLRDLTAGLAAGAASAASVALLALPGLPVGLALAAGAVSSAAIGGVVLGGWSRSAVRDGAAPDAARTQALVALAAAHAAAAVPIGLAVLLAA